VKSEIRATTSKRCPAKEKLVEAIHKNMGNLAAVAATFAVTRNTVYHWVDRYGIWAEVNKARDSLVDLAEAKLMEKLREGDPRLIEFTLRTLGRIRGYADTMEHSGQVRVTVTYERPDE
jgi:transposase